MKLQYYPETDSLYIDLASQPSVDGFLITAYPTDAIKAGDTVWTRSN
jgi:uncharacterized protein YuzE